jgi:hypothetical protein
MGGLSSENRDISTHQQLTAATELADLAQERELCRRWHALNLFFHTPPCGGSKSCKPAFYNLEPSNL